MDVQRHATFPRPLRLKGIIFCLAVAFWLILLPACTTTSVAENSAAVSGIKYGGSVSIMPGPFGLFNRNFNPFQINTRSGTTGMIYETLLFFNQLNGKTTGWLATNYLWSSDLTRLTFTLRSGVTWTDGQPFTSQDVVYTLDLLRQYRQVDTYGLSNFIKDVTNPDAHTVIIQFYHPAVPELWYIAGQTYIVPYHIWRHIKNPVTDPNPDPVGTGPFMLTSFDPALYVLGRNPHYWQPGKPYIDELRYPAYESNASADLILAQGSIDWDGIYSAKLQTNFVDRDPASNHYWFPPVKDVMLYMNLTSFPFNILAVRQAINQAINRQRLSVQGETGFEPPADPTGLVLPSDQAYLDPAYANLAFSVSTSKATTLLADAGFIRGSDGIYVNEQGQRLAFTLNVVSGWTDWENDCLYIAQDLKTIGIAVTINHLSYNDYLTDLEVGSYNSAISWTASGPSPYYLYNGLLASANSAPLGKVASSNWERWNDTNTDQLLTQFAESNSLAVQQQALNGLQRVMVEQVPVIPLLYSVDWYEYTTTRFVGWPTQQDPYATPSPYVYPDSEVVALHLHQV
jgi:peptide/nickel transport system substrate-binding protein